MSQKVNMNAILCHVQDSGSCSWSRSQRGLKGQCSGAFVTYFYIFSSPGRSPGRAIVLALASAAALEKC